MAQSVGHQTLPQVHDLTVHGFEPRIRLCADSSEPGNFFGFYVFLSLCSSPTHVLSLSKINIKKKISELCTSTGTTAFLCSGVEVVTGKSWQREDGFRHQISGQGKL